MIVLKRQYSGILSRCETRLNTLIAYPTELCLLNKPVDYYYFVAQGKTSIPGVDDAEELTITDVSQGGAHSRALLPVTSCLTHFLCSRYVF